MEKEVERRHSRGASPFHFEAGWVQEENCEMIVENVWRLTMEARGGNVETVV